MTTSQNNNNYSFQNTIVLIFCPPYVLLVDRASNLFIESMQDSFAITFTNISLITQFKTNLKVSVYFIEIEMDYLRIKIC